jgi:hypothetical protein
MMLGSFLEKSECVSYKISFQTFFLSTSALRGDAGGGVVAGSFLE